MLQRIKNLQDVVDWGLCLGCGACAYACQEKSVSLVNVEEVGIRPAFKQNCGTCNSCLAFCPGYSVDAYLASGAPTNGNRAHDDFGSALEIWEGHATDPEVRFRGSSGGVLSALSLYCLEREGMGFVLHAATDPEKPWLNKTVVSRTREEILSRTGSRYAPASPCEGLGRIEESDRPCVFIGKPSDAAATMRVRRERPKLDQNLGLVLTFFCAGEPSTKGTLDLIRDFQMVPSEVRSVRYRGEGWPGRFKVVSQTNEKSLTYQESWGKLTKYRAFRWQLDPDGMGRVADISCGDAWEKFDSESDAGRSIVLVRTERGRQILQRAMTAGYVQLWKAEPSNVIAGQPGLVQRRKEIFGRILGMKLLLVPTPKLKNFSLFRAWLTLPFQAKFRTVLGTMRRVIQRGYWHRRPLRPV